MPPPKATLRPLPSHRTGLPPITRTTFPTCRAHYPGGSSGCACRLLPRFLCSLPQMAGGSASALSLSRPAQALLALQARRIARPPIGDLCHEAPARAVTRTSRSSATGSIDNSPRVDSSSTDNSRLRGALPRADLAADRTRSICGRKWNKRFALHRDHAAHTPPQPMSVLGLVEVIVCHYRLPYSPCLAEQAE